MCQEVILQLPRCLSRHAMIALKFAFAGGCGLREAARDHDAPICLLICVFGIHPAQPGACNCLGSGRGKKKKKGGKWPNLAKFGDEEELDEGRGRRPCSACFAFSLEEYCNLLCNRRIAILRCFFFLASNFRSMPPFHARLACTMFTKHCE